MKKNIIFVLGAALLFAACGSTPTQAAGTNGAAPAAVSTISQSLDGTWQLSADQSKILVFYGDTWRIIEDGKIAGRGIVYRRNRNEIALIQQATLGFLLSYTLEENTLTVNNSSISWMDGTWNKTGSGMDSSDANPLVGTWKLVDEQGVLIYQIYSDGTGCGYDCSSDLGAILANIIISYNTANVNSGDFSQQIAKYDMEKRDGSGTFQRGVVSYELNGDELVLGSGFTLKRQ